MTLGRKDFSITRTDGGADVFGLAGFLRDDDLIGHDGARLEGSIRRRRMRTYSEQGSLTSCLFTAMRVSQAPKPFSTTSRRGNRSRPLQGDSVLHLRKLSRPSSEEWRGRVKRTVPVIWMRACAR